MCLFESLSSGVAQGVVTGIRGLCNGLGPALFGFIFYLFNVDLNENNLLSNDPPKTENNLSHRTFNNSIQVSHLCTLLLTILLMLYKMFLKA